MDDRFAGMAGPEDPFNLVNEARIKDGELLRHAASELSKEAFGRLKPKRKRPGSEPRPVIPELSRSRAQDPSPPGSVAQGGPAR